MLKNIVIILLKISLIIFSKFIKVNRNRIFITSFNGKCVACNPYYIIKNLLKNKHSNIEIVVFSKLKNLNYDKIKFITKKNLKYYFYFFSSKILITNDSFSSYMPKKSNQILINTWHGGGAYKRVNAKKFSQKILYKILYSDTNYFLSSCEIFSNVMSKDLYIHKIKFLKTGMPRNDIFFYSNIKENIKQNVREKFALEKDECIILYAPTWRDDNREIISKVSNKNVIIAFKNFLNKKIKIFIRAHYNTKQYSLGSDFIDVTDYPDMQELLCAADILITDYSSCMWDFSLMYKPCFIYATDIDQYKQERDFYTPMSEWPFPIATNTDELINNILNFNQKEYVQKVKQHHKDLGSFEDGHACERICKLIEDIIDGKVQK